MELRLTAHAETRMQERHVSRAEVEAVLERPEHVTVGETAVEYDGIVGGRQIVVIVVRESSPPLVITVIAPEE